MLPATIGGSETASLRSVNGTTEPSVTSADMTSPSELAIHRRLLASTGPVQKIGPVLFFSLRHWASWVTQRTRPVERAIASRRASSVRVKIHSPATAGVEMPARLDRKSTRLKPSY